MSASRRSDETAQRELLSRLADLFAAADLPQRHPQTGAVQDVFFPPPQVFMTKDGGELVVTLVDRATRARYGYRLRLPVDWYDESPAPMLAGLVGTQILEVIESDGLPPGSGVEGDVVWIDDD